MLGGGTAGEAAAWAQREIFRPARLAGSGSAVDAGPGTALSGALGGAFLQRVARPDGPAPTPRPLRNGHARRALALAPAAAAGGGAGAEGRRADWSAAPRAALLRLLH